MSFIDLMAVMPLKFVFLNPVWFIEKWVLRQSFSSFNSNSLFFHYFKEFPDHCTVYEGGNSI